MHQTANARLVFLQKHGQVGLSHLSKNPLSINFPLIHSVGGVTPRNFLRPFSVTPKDKRRTSHQSLGRDQAGESESCGSQRGNGEKGGHWEVAATGQCRQQGHLLTPAICALLPRHFPKHCDIKHTRTKSANRTVFTCTVQLTICPWLCSSPLELFTLQN